MPAGGSVSVRGLPVGQLSGCSRWLGSDARKMQSIEHGQGAPGQGKSAADTFRDRDARGSGRRGFDAPRARPLRKRRTEGPGMSRSLPKSAQPKVRERVCA